MRNLLLFFLPALLCLPLKAQPSQTTIQNLTAYFQTHDTKYLTEDVEFTDMSTGHVTKGREEVGKMLHYIYHEAFDARAENKNSMITEGKAVLEATFTGTHIGEFAGLKPTGKNVRVPLCVVYDLLDGQIKSARVYMLVSVMIQQLQN